MMNNSNHIDNWLQQSAALGNTPFDNADWIAMQQLLEKKRRRKLLILWLVIGIVILGVALFFLLNKDIVTEQATIKNENNIIAKTEHQSKKNIQQTNTQQNNILNSDSITSIEKTVDINKESEVTTALDKYELNKRTNKETVTKNDDTRLSKKSINTKPSNKKSIATDKKNNNYSNAITKSFEMPKQKTTANNNVSDVLNAIEKNNSNSANKGYLPEIQFMHNRYIDSLKNTIIIKDSNVVANAIKQQTVKEDSAQKINNTNSKKTTKQKNYFEIAAGFASLNIGNEMQTGLIKLHYNILLFKNFYVDVGSKAFLFNTTQPQTHTNIYDIRQSAGTIFKEVRFKETTYKVNNGAGVEPGIGLHYQFNKIDIGAAFNYGFILNKENTTQKLVDSSNFYTVLPPDIKISGGDYDNKNFVGKSYSTISFSCAYAISNKWRLQASYGSLFWYNKLEGVPDESKKRSSFYFTIGYRF